MSIETMSQKLKMFREINGMSQEQLGEKLNVSEKTISAWENNDREINLSNAKLICELFNIPNSYFVFNENFEKISTQTQKQIKEYSKNLEIKCKIETIISVCKKKIESDKLLLKKEYLPVFDYDKKGFISYGIFDPRYLPVKAKCVSTDSQQVGFGESISFNNIIDNMNSYRYDPSQLSKYNLYEVLKLQFDTLELKDLTECNCVEILKETVLKIFTQKIFWKNHLRKTIKILLKFLISVQKTGFTQKANGNFLAIFVKILNCTEWKLTHLGFMQIFTTDLKLQNTIREI